MKHPSLFTRRDFLQTGVLGGSAALTLPAFVGSTMQQLAAAEGADDKDQPILLVIQLAGGNDGLNTVVPWENDHYYRARTRLAVKKGDCLKLDDEFGLNKNARGFKQLWDDGKLGVIHGVGYPNPNRSHFRSTEIWHTASDSKQQLAQGWIGRYFDNHCKGAEPSVGISITKQSPQAFRAKNPIGVTFDDPSRFRFEGLEDGDTPEEELFLANNDGGSINMLESGGQMKMEPGMSALDFLERTALDAQVSSDQIDTVLKAKKTGAKYPGTPFSRQLQLIAQLIAGGMGTRVYYASRGGFDTHANQAASHGGLWQDVSNALLAFQRDLEAQGHGKRVTTLVFTEFGRRVKENASGGTDHGAAGPAFVIGSSIKPGFHGTMPSLAPADLFRGDLEHSTDFRSVYATMMDQVLGVDSVAVLGRKFESLKLFG